MAMSLNKVQLIGNLTRDPEMRQIPGGQIVSTFGMATNFTWTDQSGQKQSKPEYHNIVAWRKLGEICGQYLKKGSKIYIDGRIQTREWEGEDGNKRYRTEIIAENMIMLDRKSGEGMPMEREAAGISDKADSGDLEDIVKEPVAKGKGKEDEINIDDLPF